MRTTWCLISALTPILLLSSTVKAQPVKPIVAVFAVEDKTETFSEEQRNILTGYLSSKLTESGAFSIVPSSQLRDMLRQEKLESYKECYEQQCQIEIGRELASNKSLASTIIKLGSTCVLTSVLYDLAKAASEEAASVKGACVIEQLVKAADEITSKISRQYVPVAAQKPVLTGGLLIKSNPSEATVWLDGIKQPGVTPLTLKGLTAEEHLLLVVKEESQHQEMVRVEPEQFSTISVLLQKPGGQLEVLSNPPEASIFLDGRPFGKTPQLLKGVAWGKHLLKLRQKGYLTATKVVTIDSKTPKVDIDIMLQRAGFVEFRTVPWQSKIILDGQYAGSSPFRRSVSIGRHTLRIEAPGYLPYDKTLEVGPDQVINLVFRLKWTDQLKQQRAATELKYQEKLERWEQQLLRYQTRSRWGYGFLFSGISLAVAGGVLYGWGYNQAHDAYEDYLGVREFNQKRMDESYDDIDSGLIKQKIAAVLFGGSALALGSAIYCFFSRGSIEAKPERLLGLIPAGSGLSFSYRHLY
jgi:hypothetical protein